MKYRRVGRLRSDVILYYDMILELILSMFMINRAHNQGPASINVHQNFVASLRILYSCLLVQHPELCAAMAQTMVYVILNLILEIPAYSLLYFKPIANFMVPLFGNEC